MISPRRHLLNLYATAVASAMAVLACCSTGRAQEMPEYAVKAAFICNFAKFVDWPTNAFAATNAPLVIGVFGDDPFGNYLRDAARKIRVVKGHPLQVRKVTFTAELSRCHILFFSSSLKRDDTQALLRNLPRVLTVSDMDGFIKAGGIIRFFTEGDRIRFDINAAAARDAGLNISSKLLMLARKSQTSEADQYPRLLCAISP